MLLLDMFHLYSICASCRCCHSHQLTVKLRIKTFLFQWKCILRLLIYCLLIGISALSATHSSLFCLYSLHSISKLQNTAQEEFSYRAANGNLWFLWISGWACIFFSGKSVIWWPATVMELHPQPQMSLWLFFLPLFEANGVTSMAAPISGRMGTISPLLFPSFLIQRSEAAGRTLPPGLPGKSQSCHYLLSAGLIQLRDRSLKVTVSLPRDLQLTGKSATKYSILYPLPQPFFLP